LAKIDRTLKQEPAYKTRPKYALLVFGPEAKTRVWLVVDGDTLYVDKNGNGDLTEPGEKVPAKKGEGRDDVLEFEVGEIRDGGLRHKDVRVGVYPLSRFDSLIQEEPEAKGILARDPQARIYSVSAEVEQPGRKGVGVGGRVVQMANLWDSAGLLRFADWPQDAPVLHFGGPWQLTLYGRNTLRLGREVDLVLGFGTPGVGKGTFAYVGYEDAIPAKLHPTAEITFPPAKAGGPPVTVRYTLKERC
jgi:hypothetical protein